MTSEHGERRTQWLQHSEQHSLHHLRSIHVLQLSMDNLCFVRGTLYRPSQALWLCVFLESEVMDERLLHFELIRK